MRLPKGLILTNICFLLLISAYLYLRFQHQDTPLDLLKKAAKAGDVNAQNDLGCYYLGSQNYDEAFKWFKKAAEQDFKSAYFNLGICYLNGLGTETDIEESISNFSKSYEKGSGNAALRLGYIYLNEDLECFDPQKSIQWFEQAAKHKILQADFMIGELYYHGQFVEKNDSLAFLHIQRAAYQGNPNGQFFLAKFYEEGFMVPVDRNLSMQWLRKAADQGLMDAQYTLSRCYLYGLGVEQNQELATYWQDQANEQRSIVENTQLISQLSAPITSTKTPISIVPLDKNSIKTETDSLYQKGFQLLFGGDTSQENKQAIDCLTQATLKGHKSARALLAYCFATGLEVHRSKVTAANLFVGKGQIKYAIGKEIYTVDFEIFEDGEYEKQLALDVTQ